MYTPGTSSLGFELVFFRQGEHKATPPPVRVAPSTIYIWRTALTDIDGQRSVSQAPTARVGCCRRKRRAIARLDGNWEAEVTWAQALKC